MATRSTPLRTLVGFVLALVALTTALSSASAQPVAEPSVTQTRTWEGFAESTSAAPAITSTTSQARKHSWFS